MNSDLKKLIRVICEEWWSEVYDKKLIDDESFKKDSIIVNDDSKKKIKAWMRKMKLG